MMCLLFDACFKFIDDICIFIDIGLEYCDVGFDVGVTCLFDLIENHLTLGAGPAQDLGTDAHGLNVHDIEVFDCVVVC